MCPVPVTVNDGAEEQFTCSVRVHGPLDPQFDWSISVTEFGQGTTQEG